MIKNIFNPIDIRYVVYYYDMDNMVQNDNENKNISEDLDEKTYKPQEKTIKKIIHQTDNFLNMDSKISSQDPNFNFGKILLGLFILIGFIIVVYSLFAAVVGESNTSAANIVFIVALICASTLVGIIFHYIAIRNKK